MRGLKIDNSARTIIAGHAFIQNIRRGHYELGTNEATALRVMAAFDELTLAIGATPRMNGLAYLGLAKCNNAVLRWYRMGHQLPVVVCLVECLLDRRGNPAPVADAVAVLAGPLAYRLDLLPRLSCVAVGRTDCAGPAAITFGFNSSSAFDEARDGFVKLLNVFA